MTHLRIPVLLILLAATALLASCSSDDTTSPPVEDTTAPLVVQVTPVQGDTDVDLDETVRITFNEDMAAASASGAIALSHGVITDLDWIDGQTLEIDHSDWPEGTEVTVTAGTALTDAAGNALAAAFAWSFWTHTSDVILLNTLPAADAVDVPLNTQVWLEFSQYMNGATLPGAITVTSPDKATHAYTLDGEEESWTLTFDADLPASTAITVTITTDAQGQYGTPLAAETSFGFTTGDVVDNTPPQLLSIEPSDGSTIPTDTSYIRMTFDEPINDDSLQPSMVSGQLILSMHDGEDAGVWSEGNTVMTVALNPPLTPGAILAVEFDSFADVNGNVQTDNVEWSVTVAGTAEFFPVIDTYIMYYRGSWSDAVGKDMGWIEAATKYVLQGGGEFRRYEAENHSSPYKDSEIPFEDYDRMKLTSSAVQFLGFYEVVEPEDKAADTDITFVPAIDWLRFPVTAETWSGTSTFSPVPLEGPTQVEYVVTVDPLVYDVESGIMDDKQGDSPTYLWLGCRKVTIEFTLTDGFDVYQEGEDVFWYCPGMGPVRKESRETSGFITRFTTLDLMWAGLEADFPD